MRRAMPVAVKAILARPHLPIAMYLTVVGWVALLSGPSGGVVLPQWLAYMWALAVAVGGTLAVVGGLGLKTRLESAGLALLAYGAVVYGVVFTVRLEAWQPALVGLAVLAMCLIRMHVLAQARKAQEVAARIVRNRDQ